MGLRPRHDANGNMIHREKRGANGLLGGAQVAGQSVMCNPICNILATICRAPWCASLGRRSCRVSTRSSVVDDGEACEADRQTTCTSSCPCAPRGLNLMALLTKLAAICARRPSSARTRGAGVSAEEMSGHRALELATTAPSPAQRSSPRKVIVLNRRQCAILNGGTNLVSTLRWRNCFKGPVPIPRVAPTAFHIPRQAPGRFVSAPRPLAQYNFRAPAWPRARRPGRMRARETRPPR